MRTPWWKEANADSRRAFDRAAAALHGAGLEAREVELGSPFEQVADAHEVVSTVDIATYCGREYDEHADLLSPKLREEIERARGISAEQYRQALEVTDSCLAALASILAADDVLLVPAVTGPAPRGLDRTGDPVFCRAWSMLGTPALTLPAATSDEGMPIGVQLVAQRGRDGVLLKCAEALFDELSDQVEVAAVAD